MLLWQWLALAMLSVLAGLDRTALAQITVSRPIVCAALSGVVVGEFSLALQLGIMLELLWLMRIPVGAAIAPDVTQVAIGSVALIRLFGVSRLDQPLPVLALIGVMGVVAAEPLKYWDVWARHLNERLFLGAVRGGQRGRWRTLVARHYLGLLVFAMASLSSLFCVIGVGSGFLWGLMDYLAALPPLHGHWLFVVFPLVGIASLLTVLKVKFRAVLFVGGYAVTFLLLNRL